MKHKQVSTCLRFSERQKNLSPAIEISVRMVIRAKFFFLSLTNLVGSMESWKGEMGNRYSEGKEGAGGKFIE